MLIPANYGCRKAHGTAAVFQQMMLDLSSAESTSRLKHRSTSGLLNRPGFRGGSDSPGRFTERLHPYEDYGFTRSAGLAVGQALPFVL